MSLADTIADLKVRVTLDTSAMQQGAQKVKSSVNGMADTAKTKSSKIANSLSAISPKFKSMIDSAKSAGASVSSSLQGMGMSANAAKIATVAAFAAIAVAIVAAVKRIVTAIWNFIQSAALLYQDAQDAEEFIVASFGTMGDSALEWAKKVSKAYGIYDTEIMNTAASLANLYRSTNIADATAVEMAEKLTTLAYDIHAAFANITLEEAQTAIKQLAQGSVRGLKALGIAMTDTDLQNYAISKGISKQGEVLSATQKQLALYRIAMEKLGSVEGKYVTDSDDVESVITKKNAKISELKESIGGLTKPLVNGVNTLIGYIAEGLTYVVQSLSKFFNVIGSFLTGLLSPAIDTIKLAFEGIWNTLTYLSDALKNIINTISSLLGFGNIFGDSTKGAEELTDATEDTTKATEEATEATEDYATVGLASFDKLNTIDDSSTEDDTEDLTTSLLGTADATSGINDEFSKISDFAKSIGESLSGWLDPIGTLSNIDWGNVWNGIKSAGEGAWNYIKGLGESVWNGLGNFANTIWTKISDFVSDIFNKWLDSIKKFWTAVYDFGKSVWDSVANFFGDAMRAIGETIYNVFKGIYDTLFGWISGIVDMVKSITDAVGNATGGAGDFLGNTWNGIKSVFGFAQGGVFAPNSPQLAILGDNKTEPEIAAPISSITQAVVNAMSQMGNGSNQTINIELNIDGTKFARAVYKPIESEAKRRGVRFQ